MTEETGASYAPVVDRPKILPKPDDLVSFTSPAPLTFTVADAVSDPDSPLEQLRYVWFLDFLSSTTKRPFSANLGDPTATVNPCLPDFAALTQPGVHLIELFVVDSKAELVTGTSGRAVIEKKTVDGEPVEVPGGFAYVAWTVEFQTVCP